MEHHPAEGRYNVHVAQGPRLIADGIARIRQAGRKYHRTDVAVTRLIEQFKRGAGAE